MMPDPGAPRTASPPTCPPPPGPAAPHPSLAACHIGLLVADLAAATEFYLRALGAVADPSRATATFRALTLRGGVVLGLHSGESWTGHGLDPTPVAAPRVLLAYQPDRPADVDRLAGRLPALGATVIRGPHHAHGRRTALLTDADGHTLCLTHPEPEGIR